LKARYMVVSKGIKSLIAAAAVSAAAGLMIMSAVSWNDSKGSSFQDRGEGIPVLAYHFINDRGIVERGLRAVGTVLLNLPLITTRDAWSVSRDNFEKQMRYLRDQGYRTITMSELESYILGKKELGEKCVAITFDDGDRSVYRHAYPLLEKYGMRGTMFVITSKVGMKWNELEISSWDELGRMEESGVIEIESHTHDMHYKVRRGDSPHPVFDFSEKEMSQSDIEKISGDLRRSKVALMYHLGKESLFLAWLYGFGSVLGDSVAAGQGFDLILTLKRGVNRPGDSPFRVKRCAVTPRTSMDEFREMLSGAGEKRI